MSDIQNEVPGSDLAAYVEAIDATADMHETPSGDGSMQWRRWGSGPPLVLLHGGSGSWTHWIRNIATLKEHFELWIADLPGMGDSAMPHHPHVPESCAEVIATGIRDIIPNGTPFHLAGFSFGGHIASIAAADLQDSMADLTLIGVAALGMPSGEQRQMLREYEDMTEDEIHEVYRNNLELLMFSKAERIDDLAVYLQMQNVQRARFRSRPFARSDAIRQKLAEIRSPVKSIWGENDIIAYPSVAARLEVIGEHHPELQARIIPDAGHWVAYEATDAFNAAVIELLLPSDTA
jgi:2-hydroxy-6-oxonona-2,4-dienedioate hydrolase